MSGSIEHYRAALRLEPDYPGGVAQLRIPSCYVKYHLGQGRGSSPTRDLAPPATATPPDTAGRAARGRTERRR